jgi:hypothetical protein
MTHPSRELTEPQGKRVQIDTALVPLIEALWAAGFRTITCCQDLGESITANRRKSEYWKGWVNLELPERDACRLSDIALKSGQFPVHWAEDGAWEMSSPLVTLPGIGTIRADIIQVRFPVDQLATLTELVQSIGRRKH